jgi:hypothetical protein
LNFLLECIGFPPDQRLEDLVELVLRDGEPAPWRGEARFHRRLVLGGGLELRADKDPGAKAWSLVPHFNTARRLRVAVDAIRPLPDSPFDALLSGWAAPPSSLDEPRSRAHGYDHDGLATAQSPGAYPIRAFLTDARKLPPRLAPGHVLALSVAGFALDVTYIGANDGGSDPGVLERENGASLQPLLGDDDPGGCLEVSLCIEKVLHLVNPITGHPFDLLEVDAPERPHSLFVSRWQLEEDGLPPPHPGLRVEGTFFLSGRIAGGLPGPARSVRGSFG